VMLKDKAGIVVFFHPKDNEQNKSKVPKREAS
jgi:hypothetical protein